GRSDRRHIGLQRTLRHLHGFPYGRALDPRLPGAGTSRPGGTRMTAPALPETGTSWPELQTRMAALAGSDVDWRRGKTAVYVFNAGEDVERVQKAAYGMFMAENGLGPSAFPSLKRMEEEVVGYGLALLHAPEGAAGAITSGGTDSIT